CGGEPPPAPVAVAPAPERPAAVVPTAENRYTAAITAEDFAARLRKLSSDEFEGRKPGTLGERLTTAWIKDQFQRAGLKPGNGTQWAQTVPMVETVLVDPEQVALVLQTPAGEERFAYRSDLIVGALDASTTVDIKDSQVVFAGYGVDAPELGWNDYAGLDVKGKTVVVLINDPGWGNHDENQ